MNKKNDTINDTIKFQHGTVVIPVKSLEFIGKDIVHIENFKDFAWLCANTTVFKLKNSYYSVSSDVAYIWIDETEKVK